LRSNKNDMKFYFQVLDCFPPILVEELIYSMRLRMAFDLTHCQIRYKNFSKVIPEWTTTVPTLSHDMIRLTVTFSEECFGR